MFHLLHTKILNFYSYAKNACKEILGYLIEYKSREEEQNVWNYLNEKFEDPFGFWVGLRDHVDESTFRWEHSNVEVI